MEFIKVLINLFLGEEKSKSIQPLLDIFANNNFDIKSSLSSLNVETLLPLITSFMDFAKPVSNEPIFSQIDNYHDYCEEELADRFDAYFNG